MKRHNRTQYNIVVKNKPGEFVKVTKLITQKGIALSGFSLAKVGDKALIHLSAQPSKVRPGSPGF